MKTPFTLLFILTLLGFSNSNIAQVSSNFTKGYYTIGLNGGWSYQTSDIRSTSDGFGLGLTLGRSLYYQPNAPLALDIRGRFLYARQYGLDPFRSFSINENPTLNGEEALDYSSYPANFNEPQGFVFQNHRTDVGELSLEAVLTLNQLRERTGFIAALYGGVGIDWYLTRMDQADFDGQEYYEAYSQLNTSDSRRAILDALQTDVLNGDYETRADGFSSSGRLSIMPSVGIELGYELTPYFAVLAGHRLTFATNDLLDGHQWKDPGNDLYHYTSLGLQWKIPAGNQQKLENPVITLLEPERTPVSTNQINSYLRARIQHVNNTADITCTLNNRPVNFSFYNEVLSTSLRLDAGRNEVIITATNAKGTARKLVVILYQAGGIVPPPPPPPTGVRPSVQITTPSSSPTTTSSYQQVIRATIRNVESKYDVQFLVNGIANQNFVYDPRDDDFSTTINLRDGNNEVEIIATNPAGTASDRVLITRANTQQPPPSVQITSPSSYTTETDRSTFQVQARIDQVDNKNDIFFRLNGRRLGNFQWTGNLLRMDVQLKPGSNLVEISAQNKYGTAEDQAEIVYVVSQPTPNPPSVEITRPATTSITISQPTYLLEATIREVNNKNDVNLTLNNKRLFDFAFNPTTGKLSKTLTLQEGQNYIDLSGSNQFGTASDKVSILYRKNAPPVANPPEVYIDTPTNNTTTQQGQVQLKARILHVTNKQDITLRLNGKSIGSFNFNNSTNQLSATLQLQEGSNSIRIDASNKDGQDDASVQITYDPQRLPEIVFVQPNKSPFTSPTQSYQVQATVKNVTSKADLRFEFNGVNQTSFQFSNERFVATVSLKEGTNLVRLRAANLDGTDQEQVQLVYAPANPPSVSITAPANNSTVNTASVELVAKIQAVNNSQDIRLYVNNKITNFQYSNGTLRANLLLQEGSNLLKVTASNQDGTAQDQIRVTYNRPLPKPEITFQQPSKPGTEVNTDRYQLKVSVEHVEQKEQIQLKLNGKSVAGFSFDPEQSVLKGRINLRPGRNDITVIASNSTDSSTASTYIQYQQATISSPPPVISLINLSVPAANPFNPTVGSSTIILKVENVDNKDQIQLLLNNEPIEDFTFDASTQRITSGLLLKKGRNALVVTATNASGSDTFTQRIDF